MIVHSITSQIASIDRDINALEKSIQNIEINIGRKQKEATDILGKISKEKDIKRAIAYQKDLSKKNDEVRNLEKIKMHKSKSLADKLKKKYELQLSLSKEEQKEREKTKKEQKEILTVQQQITREVQYQKNLTLHSIDIFKPYEKKIYLKNEWPQRELDGLFAREINGEKVILPIWHKVSKNEVLKYSPIIADLLAINTSLFTIE